VDTIVRAMEAVDSDKISVTDDTGACELIGQPVVLVQSKRPNPKVTTNADLAFVTFLFQ